MSNNPLPIELARRWGNLPDIKQRSGNEWSSACPQCGGGGRRDDASDRFRMFAATPTVGARGWCRQCHYFAFVDDDRIKPDPEIIAKAQAERLVLLEAENIRIREKLRRVADADFWRRWHGDMTIDQRQLWRQQGVIDYLIDYYSLGFCADYTTTYDGQEWHSPTMTIPHYAHGWELVNIQHRLLNPPETNDKYRQMSGVPASAFITEPEEKLDSGVLIVEGAKKAIVVYMHLGANYNGRRLHVIGIPGKAPSQAIIDTLANADPIYLMLDPDAYVAPNGQTATAAGRLAKKLGAERVLGVSLPVKPDDFFTQYGGRIDDLLPFLSQAKRAK